MTPELENAMWRAGLTSAQVAEITPAIEAYATDQATQASAGFIRIRRIDTDIHFLAGAGETVACGVPNVNLVNTTQRSRVTCGPCRATPAWKATA